MSLIRIDDGMDEEKEVTAIKKVLNQYAAGVNSGDFTQWISLWADDGVQMPPNTPVNVGKMQIIDGNKPAFDQMDLKIEITSVEEARVYGDYGLTRCEYSLTGAPKTGGATVDVMKSGKALTLYRKQSDGTWKIVYDCFNSNL
jgi:uncharacterized protein (TIGR02246 family)